VENHETLTTFVGIDAILATAAKASHHGAALSKAPGGLPDVPDPDPDAAQWGPRPKPRSGHAPEHPEPTEAR
jgi:hypothetical protein